MESAGGLHPPPPPIAMAGVPPPPLPSNNTPFHEVVPLPIPPPTQFLEPPQIGEAPGPPPIPDIENQTTSDDRHHDSDDASGSEHEEDSEDEDVQWFPIEEDKSEPCTDELAFIESREEYSALDDKYWEKQAFFDLNDPELLPVGSGTIDFLVDRFNGTKDNPNHENVLRSNIVQIGGLDWQLKFFPKGDRSEYLSLYLECVSMLKPEFEEFEEFDHPPFPFLKGFERIKKRRSVAVQFGVVMYNPDEPRVHECQIEAGQFHKKKADLGWKYFSRYSRFEFQLRQHGQRRAILRDDKLAFRAYIQIVQDPTGCLWDHESRSPQQITAVTGLRPFTKSLQYIAAAVPLLHFAPFRDLVQSLRPDTQVARWLQPLLLKMYTRKLSANYGLRCQPCEGDVSELLWRLARCFQSEYQDGPEWPAFKALVGSFRTDEGAVCGTSRLDTKTHNSVQEAVTHHMKLPARPKLLTLELQRQEHDKKERKWKKLTNKVKINEKLQIGAISYTLFAFVTHCGHVRSNRYNSYVRPKGFNKGWYAYQDGKVTRLTEKQARERHSGTDPNDNRPKTPEDGYDSPFSEFHEPTSEVTCVVMYVREDVVDEAFNAPDVELWVPPHLRAEDIENPLPTAVHEYFPRSNGPDPQESVDEEEYARLCALREAIDQAAVEETPEPVLMDGDDVIMKDADDNSNFSMDEPATETITEEDSEQTNTGIVDWLGRPYYEGQWKDRLYHGGGHLIASNGDEYVGQFKEGFASGYGKMIYSSTGDVYEGQWRSGEHHGKGKLIEHSTGNVFEGSFQEGKKHGDFVLRGTVTDEDKSCCKVCFDKEMTTAFYDCGHVVACRECAAQVEICPICRRRVVARLQLYGVRISQS